MKALFFAAALVLAAVSSSYAAPAPVEVIRVQPHKVHKYLLGLWCSDDGLHYIVYFDDHLVEEQCRHDNVITIKADHYIGHEYGCTFTRIDAWVHPVAMATKTIGSPAFEAPRVCRRPFRLSHAAMAGCSSMA